MHQKEPAYMGSGFWGLSHCHPGRSEAKSRGPEYPPGIGWVPDMFIVKTSKHSGMTVRPAVKHPKTNPTPPHATLNLAHDPRAIISS